MKQVNNIEVDLLLRSLAGARGKSHSQSGSDLVDGEASSDHLDADELNSYAEGVVPAPARARYIEHLADCEVCRRSVIDLAQTSGAVTRYEVPQQQGGANFWQKLGALLSPAVLRYAVPALVLTAVIGISFLALRQPRQAEFIARNNPTDSSQPSTAPRDSSDELSPSTGATPSSLPSGIDSGTNIESRSEKSDLQDQKIQVQPAPLASRESTVAKAPALKDSTQPSANEEITSTRPYASEPKAAAPPPPPVTFGQDKSAELKRERSEKREDQPSSRDAFRVQTDGEHGPNRSRSNTAAPTGGRTAGLMSGRGPSADKNKKASEVDTRAVSGRRFTREGNAWVDTDYDSSQSTINVARGSDRFRALVADEPSIRAIADQLSGVVIVVWKNRAYRIQ